MKNTTVLGSKSDLNEFTIALKARCVAAGPVLVRMRNGDYAQVMYKPANPQAFEEQAFHTPDHSAYWEASGHSVTGSRFDLVEFEDVPGTSAPASVAETRLKQACWLSLEFAVNRYLMSNANGRWDGAEKAMRHIELCTFYVALFRGVSRDEARIEFNDEFRAVHEHTQALTDNLDEAIGFPLESDPDYDVLAPKFFEQFHAAAIAMMTQIVGLQK